MKKEIKIEATNRYEVKFNKKPEYNAVYEFRREPSACFSYGNGSAVAIFCNDSFVGIVDTRYDHEVMRDFDEWCVWYLDNYFDPKFEPVIKKI